jgi:acyl carrier protein
VSDVIWDVAVKCISEVFRTDPDCIVADATLDDLGANSLRIVELAVTLEDELNISIPDKNVIALDPVSATVSDLVALVRRFS